MQSLMDIRHVESLADVEESFCVMRELRPHLKDRGAYVVQIQHQRTQGYRLLAARSNGVIVGLAGYRQMDSLLYGRFVYVDDLVVTGSLHRSGFGERLLQAAREQALALKCDTFRAGYRIAHGAGTALSTSDKACSHARHAFCRTAYTQIAGKNMTRILLLNSGPHSDASHGYRLATGNDCCFRLRTMHEITERDLVQSPIPPIGRDYAIAITSHTPHRCGRNLPGRNN
jgi:GNAT superfamily N-acetyltransferase